MTTQLLSEPKNLRRLAYRFLWSFFISCIFFVPETDALEVKPGGMIFAHYEFVTSQHLKNGTPVQDYSAFEVSRIYLNADAKYDEKISAFVQLEANLTSRDNKNNRVFLKNAELRFNLHPAAKIYAGLVSVPWRGWEESVWKHRFVAKTLEDQDIGMPASDRGIRLNGQVPFLTYDLMVANGEGPGGDGTAGNESTASNGGGRFKDYTARVSAAPLERLGETFKGLKLNALFHKGNKNEIQLRNRIFAGLSYESKHLNAMWTYYNADNSANSAPSRGEGFSFHTVVAPVEKFWVFARLDKYDPDLHVGGDARTSYFYGLGYQIIKGVRIAVDHQYLQQERRSIARQDESIFFVHTEAKF